MGNKVRTESYNSSGYPSPVLYDYLMEARAELEVMTADRDKWKELYEQEVRSGK